MSNNDTNESRSNAAQPLVTDYQVEGMTCGHCKMSVTEEVIDVPGVNHVDVDVPTGRLTVTGDVSADAIKAAVKEAGYRVVA